jgi:cation/acetate symporter
MFGLSYETAIVVVGAVMLAYVLFGGMIATTWVQIVKAALLLGGAAFLAVLVLAQFGFNPLRLFAAAADRYGGGVLAPGKLISSPWEAVSLGLARNVNIEIDAAYAVVEKIRDVSSLGQLLKGE